MISQTIVFSISDFFHDIHEIEKASFFNIQSDINFYRYKRPTNNQIHISDVFIFSCNSLTFYKNHQSKFRLRHY